MQENESSFGRYRLIVELGHGGMADVFLAVQQGPAGFNKLVVIKRLRPSLAEDPDFVAMLLDEARIAARLNHPNVVQTNEIGSFGKNYFIAMEYLDGQPLNRIMHRVRNLDDEDPFLLYATLVDVLAGLHHAHTLNDFDGTPLDIVHRDVSPQNVFVTYDGGVKVVDFGIAKAVGRASAETRQGVIKGKISYMSPEQASGAVIDARADVFAVGVMLWEAATRRRLWKGVDEMEILRRLVLGEVPQSPRAVAPEVPEEIDRICCKALAPLAERYTSAEAMRAELDAFLAKSGRRPSGREIGACVARLFEEKRAELKQILEAKLAELKSVPPAQFVPFVMPTKPNGPDSVTIEGTNQKQLDGRDGHTAMTGVTRLSDSRLPPPRQSRKALWAGLGLTAVTFVGLVTVGVQRSGVTVAVGRVAPAAPAPVGAAPALNPAERAAETNPATPPNETDAGAATAPAAASEVKVKPSAKVRVQPPVASPRAPAAVVPPTRREDDGLSSRK